MKVRAIFIVLFLLLAANMIAPQSALTVDNTIQNVRAEIQKLASEIQKLHAQVTAQKKVVVDASGNIPPQNIELILQCHQLQMLQLQKQLLEQKVTIIEQARNARNTPPIGTIILVATDKIPAGYLLCDGRTVAIEKYQKLFKVIGTTWGKANNSMMFKIPDLRGQFIRILDQGKGLDPGRKLGQFQDGATAMPKNHFVTENSGEHSHSMSPSGHHSHGTHAYLGPGGPMAADRGTGAFGHGRCVNGWHSGTHGVGDHTHTVQKNGTHRHTITGGDKETRPVSQALIACIKY